ncbi:MAG: amino acid carrier protein [Gammaproteobacteria bacterium]
MTLPGADTIESIFTAFANFMWGMPMVILVVGGGLFFLCYSRLLPFRYFRHGIDIVRGKYDEPHHDGDIPHYQALSTALSGTLGLGNVAGVAVAITMGGPGAVFWMWMTAVVGVATKFYTASLAVMYRGRDDQGNLQGGPMYVIREGLGRRWLPLAGLFAVAGLFGTLPVFQINQMVQLIRDLAGVPLGLASKEDHFFFDFGLGVIFAVLVLVVITGHIKRVGAVTGRMVPGMVVFYLFITAWILVKYIDEVPAAFMLILRDAFSGEAAAGGAIGAVIIMGVRRGAFSNEAGIGTESLAHGAAKTNEPIREGLVAMLGPVIDTLIVCTCTALAILVTGVWHSTDADGVTLTARAFEAAIPDLGVYILMLMIAFLGFSTIVSYWYYGTKCMGFLFGARRQKIYLWLYTLLIVAGAVVSLDTVLGLIDGMFAVMAIPTMISALLLAPRVNRAAEEYFSQYSHRRHRGPQS